MTYVIRRTDGKFVAPPGMDKTYTDKLQYAQVFHTYVTAEAERCPENEQVLRLEQAMCYNKSRRI